MAGLEDRETQPFEGIEGKALLQELLLPARSRIYAWNLSAPIDNTATHDLALIISECGLEIGDIIFGLFPPVCKFDKLNRAVSIINSALKIAGSDETVTRQDFLDRLA